LQGRSRFGYLDLGRARTTSGQPPRPADAAPPPRPPARPLWLDRFEGSLDGRREDGPEGPRLVVRRLHRSDEVYGGRRLAEFLTVSRRSLGWLGRDPAVAEADPREVVFLDCETTGLAGGTGTKVFLVGVARFGPDGLHVEQHFLPDYDVERPFLAGADAALSGAGCLATFNGKSFDLPLLDTRLALWKRRADWLDLPHLDLLHPARRLWRRRLESCSLTALEEQVLGFAREGDVPGWLIPSLYFGFLRTGDLAPLEPVFEHNRRDLLSLVVLATRLGRIVAGEEEPEHPLDSLGLARMLEDCGEVERAIAAYERALAGDLPPENRDEARARLALLYKRLRRDERALAAWDAIVQGVGSRSALALVELAKHYEHRARDYARAAEVTRRALRTLALRPEATIGEASVEALERRLRRLERKVWRAEGCQRIRGAD